MRQAKQLRKAPSAFVSPWLEVIRRAWAVSVPATVTVVACCLLVALGAQVRIPIPGTDVPATLQFLAVLFTGFALRPGRASAAMLLYLTLGTLGLPVFAAGSGGVLGLTGGYLVGFVGAAWLVSTCKGRAEASPVRLIAAGFAGMTAVYLLGVAWRCVWLRGDFSLAVATGLAPFVVKDTVAVVLAAMLVVSVRGGRRGRSSHPVL